MATYVNDLRLKEISTGDESGTWGTSTNTNLELIAEAFSFGTEAITTNADTHTTTIADGSTDPGRSMFLKYTGTLDSACTITIGPNTVSKLWFIENATSGSQSIIIKQGSGATITIANGQVKAIYSDGAGSGGAMVDAFQDLSVPDLFIDDDLTFTSDSAVITFGADGDTTLTHTDGSGLTLNSTNKIMFNDASQFIQGSSATVLALGATDEIDLTATLIDINGNADVSGTVTATGTSVFASLDISGDIDVDGTANLDVVDIDGAVDMDSTLQVDGAITSSAGATITVADNSDNLTLTSTDADANAGPNVKLYRNSSSPADGDSLGFINFYGENDADEETLYGQIRASIADASDGSEDARFIIQTAVGGTQETSRVELTGTETIINEDSKDLDFRVESDANTHALFVEGSSSNVGIGTSSPSTKLQVTGNSSSRNTIVSNVTLDGGTTVANPYEGFGFGINFIGRDYGNAVRNYASINTFMQSKSSSSGGGDAGFTTGLSFYTNNGGASGTNPEERMRIDSAGNVLVGKTSSSFGTDGVEIKNDQIWSTNTSSDCISLNRKTSDGAIATFYKDASTVGSINNFSSTEFGLVSQKNLVLTQNTTTERNLVFSSSYFGSFGADDATIDLGRSVGRWKDFYLAGDIAHLDTAGNARLLYDRSSNLLGNAGTNLSCASALVGSSGASFGELMTVNSNGASYSAHLFATSGATAPLICRNQNGVSGTRSQIIFYYDASSVGSITSTSSGTALVSSSDQRLKENIVDADDAGSKIDAIQVRKFDWKVDGSHQEYGFVAQELEPVFSHAVHTAEDDMQTKSVDYASLVPMLVKEIQSLRARVQQLEND